MIRNYGCRIQKNIKINGIDAVVMENQKIRMTILVGKGCDIYELLYKPKDIDFMWRSPNELINPREYAQFTGDSLHNYIDLYVGGWQEILPSGGPACNYKGAELGMHGEIVNVPWQYEIINNEEEIITMKFWVRTRRTPFNLEKIITLRNHEANIYFEETLYNEGYESMSLMWGHHPTLGAPFLDENCIIKTSAKSVRTDGPEKDFDSQRLEPDRQYDWPLVKGTTGKNIDLSKIPSKSDSSADLLYLSDFEEQAYYEVLNQRMNVSFGIEWNKQVFPYCWMWLVCNGAMGYPWYGRTYNMALEPWTSYPSKGLSKVIENGTCLELDARSNMNTSFTCFIKEY